MHVKGMAMSYHIQRRRLSSSSYRLCTLRKGMHYIRTSSYVASGILALLFCRCGIVASTLAFGSIGRGFESEHRLLSYNGASGFSNLRLLA